MSRTSLRALTFAAALRAATAAEPLSIETSELPRGAAGAAYQASIEGGGGVEAGYSWRIAPPGLPGSLRLEAPSDCPARDAPRAVGALDASLPSPRLDAVSGLEASHRNPGVFWVHDDADSRIPEIYALAADGSHLRTYVLPTAPTDWEDIALGPGPESGKEPRKDYLYIGDFGDNSRSRPYAWLLRAEEPDVTAGPEALRLEVETIYYRYPDGSRDMETLIIDPATGTPYVVERSAGGCRAYRFPLPLDPGRGPASPVEVSLITRSALLPETLTGGDVSPDGRRVILRNYTKAFEYVRPEGAPFEEIFSTRPCATFDAGSQQYEGICYGPNGASIYTTTERAGHAGAPILSWTAKRSRAVATILGALPDTAGEYSITIELGDGAADAVTKTFRLQVLPGLPRGPLPGDCDRSGSIDLTDAFCLLGLIFGGAGWTAECEPSSEPRAWLLVLDWNGDGGVDLSDAVALLIHLFSAGDPHAQGGDCLDLQGCAAQCAGG